MSRYDDLLAFEFPEVEQTYSERDTILYALGVGAGSGAAYSSELALVYEEILEVIPSMAVTLAYPGFWYRDLAPGLDFLRTVHASERFEIHRPLPVAGTVVARPRIVAIHDKGEGRGSLVVSRREIIEKPSGARLATVTQTAFCRGDGGLGGPLLSAPPPPAMPDASPQATLEETISSRAALIYRLSGDYNPLHIDPGFARDAGFPAPILHGLSTYGHICRSLMRHAGGGRHITTMDCRFTGPVYPGDTLSIQIWPEARRVLFRAFVGERRVIDNGICEFG
jgi:acyl dehydratase